MTRKSPIGTGGNHNRGPTSHYSKPESDIQALEDDILSLERQLQDSRAENEANAKAYCETEVELTRARDCVAEQKLRLECHVRDETALRSEVKQADDAFAICYASNKEFRARVAELEGALEEIAGCVLEKQCQECMDAARAALGRKP